MLWLALVAGGGRPAAAATPPPATPAIASGQVSGQVSGQPLGLQEAVDITVRLLPAIAASAASAQAADARIAQARSAWLPSLSASWAYSRQTANFVLRPGMLPSSLTGSGTSYARTSRSFNYWNGQLQLSQLFWDFGATAYAINASRALWRQSNSAVRQAVLEATWATRSAFFAAQGAKHLAAVAHKTLDNQERHRAQIRGQVQVGQRPPIDLAQGDTAVSQAQVALIQAQNNEAIAYATLAQAMGVEGLQGPLTVNDDTLGEIPDEGGATAMLLGEAIANRPEMRGLNQAASAQGLKLKALVAGLLPQLGGSASFTEAGQQVQHLGWNWNAGVSVTWPLVAGGNGMAQIREAQALLRQAQANVNTGRNAIHLELTRAQLNLQAAKLSLSAANDGVVNAGHQLALAEGRYATGLGSVIELSDAQLAWATANSQKVQAEVSLATARATFLKALGRDR
jgi:outer membrane protein